MLITWLLYAWRMISHPTEVVLATMATVPVHLWQASGLTLVLWVLVASGHTLCVKGNECMSCHKQSLPPGPASAARRCWHPQVLHESLAVLLHLLDRLEGLALTFSQPPFLSGSYHGRVYYTHFVQPLDAGWRTVIHCCGTVSQLAAASLRQHDTKTVQKLHTAIEALIQQRHVQAYHTAHQGH